MAPLFLQNLFAYTCGLTAVALVSGCSSPGPAKWASNQRPVHHVWGGPQHLSSGTEALLTGGSSEVAADTRRQAGAVEQINALIQRVVKDASPMADDAVLRAYLFSLRVVSHNIANVNTCGYRRSAVVFGEGPEGFRLSARADSSVPATPLADGLLPELECSVRRSFRQGPVKATGERMDIAILGEGFLEVQMPDGTAGYTRAGMLAVDAAGEWVTREGFRLVGFGHVATGTTEVSISPHGTVMLTSEAGSSMFHIQLTRFANPSGLRPLAENVYAATEASGAPEMGSPDGNGFGKIYQGFLELSNVDLAVELQELIRLHSAYESYRSARKVLDAVARDLKSSGPGPLAPGYGEWIEASVSR